MQDATSRSSWSLFLISLVGFLLFGLLWTICRARQQNDMLQDAIRTVAETEEVGRFFLVCTPHARDREGGEERESRGV
jgi:hypothetical protein